MKNKDDRRKRLPPRDVLFLVFFGGSFLPGLFGKASASLAGMVLALYLLSFAKGGKRFVLAVVYPVVACVFVRVLSGLVYSCILSVETRAVAFGKVYALMNIVVHYCERIWETVVGFRLFFETWDFRILASNIQFVLVLLGMGVCVVSVIRRKAA